VGRTNDGGSAIIKPASAFRDCRDCPEMLVVPAGSFMMGSPDSEPGRFDNEGPQHRVTLVRAFAIGKYEVTVAEFRAFENDSGIDLGGGDGSSGSDCDWQAPDFSQTDRHPVVCMSWHDANAYVAWLSQKTGKRYRLLTESEWEYAARAGTATSYFWGSDPRDLCEYANGNGTTCQDGYDDTAPVGSYKPNAFGLYDMAGNAWEWVQDCFSVSYERTPIDGSAATDVVCAARALRGGSWYYNPQNLRSANRQGWPVRRRENDFGFRVARTL
jgi:formylglycine-generating enzyme required for sulfatase activity